MQILSKPAEYHEVEIGDPVELLENFTFIRSGAVGKVVAVLGDVVRVEFPWIEVGVSSHFPTSEDDKFIQSTPENFRYRSDLAKGGK